MDLGKRLDGAAELEDPEYAFFKQNTPRELDIVGSSSEVEDHACEVWEDSNGALSRAEGFSAALVPLRCLRLADLLLLWPPECPVLSFRTPYPKMLTSLALMLCLSTSARYRA